MVVSPSHPSYGPVFKWFEDNQGPDVVNRFHEAWPDWEIKFKDGQWSLSRRERGQEHFWEHWAEGESGRVNERLLELIGFPTPPLGHSDRWLKELYQAADWEKIFEWSDPSLQYFSQDRPDRWLEALATWVNAGEPRGWYDISNPASVQAELLFESGFRPPTPEGRAIRDEERRAWREYRRKQSRAQIAQVLSWALPMLFPFTQPYSWLNSQISALTAKVGFGKAASTSIISQGASIAQALSRQKVYQAVLSRFVKTGLDTWIWGQGQANLQRGIFKALTGKTGKPSLSPSVFDIPSYLTNAFQSYGLVQEARQHLKKFASEEMQMARASLRADATKAIELYREYFGLDPRLTGLNWNELVSIFVNRKPMMPVYFRALKYGIQHYEKWVPRFVKTFPGASSWVASLFAEQSKVQTWNYAARWSEPLTALYWARKAGYEGDLHPMWDLPFWFLPIPGTRAVKGLKVARQLAPGWKKKIYDFGERFFPGHFRKWDTSKGAQAVARGYDKSAQAKIQAARERGYTNFPAKIRLQKRVKYGRKWVPVPAQPLIQFPEPIDLETFIFETAIKTLTRPREIAIKPHHVDIEGPGRSSSGRFKGRVPWRFRRRGGVKGRIHKRRYWRRR